MSQPEPEVIFEVVDHIGLITLNRPERLNAATRSMVDTLISILDRADDDDDIRVLVMTGAGRGFCAGADLSGDSATFNSSASEVTTRRDYGGLLALRILASHTPIIAAINGPAVGMGITMTLPMDIRMASHDAKFGFVFARRGITPEACSSWFLPRVVGISQAMEWVFTGRTFSADDALAAGLIRSVHPSEELLPAAMDIASEIAENASLASVAISRQLMWRSLTTPSPLSSHLSESYALGLRAASTDIHEGVDAFFAKRQPSFMDSPAAAVASMEPYWPDGDLPDDLL